jgi:hypothetical protein
MSARHEVDARRASKSVVWRTVNPLTATNVLTEVT